MARLPPESEIERLIDALRTMEKAAESNATRSRQIQQRAENLRTQLLRGVSAAEAVEQEPRPRTVELLTTNMETLETAGAELRAAQALALRADGMTIADIADLFGVTRQRISALLRQRAASPSQHVAGGRR